MKLPGVISGKSYFERDSGDRTLTAPGFCVILSGPFAGMMELVDVQDLGSCGAIRVGSSPTARTIKAKRYRCHWRKASDINRFRAFLQLKIHR